jgi:SAM-dependent methyltransferase
MQALPVLTLRERGDVDARTHADGRTASGIVMSKSMYFRISAIRGIESLRVNMVVREHRQCGGRMIGASAARAQSDYDAWAEYYDLTEGDRHAIVSFYRSLVSPVTGSILDLGCGTGLITAAMAGLASADASVVGVDLSSRMLERARARAPGIHWVPGDIRAPAVDGRFDLVTCCYNTLQMLPEPDDVLQAMRAARDRLATNGRFAFDMFQPNLPRLRIPKRDRLLHAYVDHAGHAIELREDAEFDESDALLTIDWRLVDAVGRHELGSIRLQLRQYPHAVVRQMLDEAGLRMVEAHGDYDRRPFDARSMRQVLVCAAA